MPKYGIHAFTLEGFWNNDLAPKVIAQAAELGFDLLEIPLLKPSEFDSDLVAKALSQNGIQAVASLCLPPDAHLPFNPSGALHFLKAAVDKVADFGGKQLLGCLYCNLATLTRQPPTDEEKKKVAEVLGELRQYATPKGVSLGIEPVNRYETYLCNTGSDAIEYFKAIGADDMIIHFDTYHMNIEEDGFSSALTNAGKYAGYIHMSESHRGLPGEGTVDWDDVFQGLHDIDYRGPLVLEAFAAINPDLIGATCLWRKSRYQGHELATKGLEFLKAKAAKYGLA
ncbi:MAG: sugar phosphate isomerase/epimerase [Verrucomicrobia bacterium]|nr:sugar phosphate isomerase/epimerase [Verrucomicrobiota bacterium]